MGLKFCLACFLFRFPWFALMYKRCARTWKKVSTPCAEEKQSDRQHWLPPHFCVRRVNNLKVPGEVLDGLELSNLN